MSAARERDELEVIKQGSERAFRAICLLHDPYDELAERLLMLSDAAHGDMSALDERDSMSFDAAIEFAASLDLSDERQLRRAFRNISAEDAATFADPAVRSLGARTPGETAQDSTMAAALEVLANCAVVGLREYPELFIEGLGAQLGISLSKRGIRAEAEDVYRELRERCSGEQKLIEGVGATIQRLDASTRS